LRPWALPSICCKDCAQILKKNSSCDTQQVSSAYSSGITGKKSTQASGKLNAHDVGVQLLSMEETK
jgi:hypothetical protein